MLTYNMDVEERSSWLRATPGAAALAQPFYCTEAGNFYGRAHFATARTDKESYLLFYTLSGSGLIEQNDQRVALPAGSALLLNCRTPQSYCTAPGQDHWHHYWAHLDGAGVANLAEVLQPQGRLSPVTVSRLEMQPLFESLAAEWEHGAAAQIEICLALHRMLALMARQLLAGDESRSNRTLIEQAAECIRQHYAEPLSLDSLLGSNIPESILPDAGISLLKSDRYQMMLISSSYVISSDAVNQQIDELNAILKKYDEGGMLIGEAPCTKDLINCTDRDFKVVSVISIAAIFVIIALVLKSFSRPILLVAMIELAIALNLCIPYFTGTTLPFVGPILISTIQLGATVDYAILMTTRYKQGRMAGKEKKVAVGEAVAASAQSILVSGVSFFASTFGVGLYSNVDIISSMCSLIARGALCSVAVVLFLLPAMLLLCDGFIVRTTVGMKKKA